MPCDLDLLLMLQSFDIIIYRIVYFSQEIIAVSVQPYINHHRHTLGILLHPVTLTFFSRATDLDIHPLGMLQFPAIRKSASDQTCIEIILGMLFQHAM